MSNGPMNASTGNRLLDHLSQDASNRLVSSGKYVTLQHGDVVYRQNTPTAAVYFPTRGCCCHVVTLNEGRRIETVTIGNEGMVGVNLGWARLESADRGCAGLRRIAARAHRGLHGDHSRKCGI